MRIPLLGSALITLVACKSAEPARTPVPSAAPSEGSASPSSILPAKLSRDDFNKGALHLNLPLYWATDANGNDAPDPDEVKLLLFYPTRGQWAAGGAFTPEFERARDAIRKAAGSNEASAGPSPEEALRRKLVIEDLDQGAPTLVASDFRASPLAEKALVRHMLAAAAVVDSLYATMRGATALQARVPGDHPPSQSLFRRNWGPVCAGAQTSKNPACSAVPGAPKPVYDAYPPGMQADARFCAALEKRSDAKALLDPFVVVRDQGGTLVPVPYSGAYAEPMRAIAAELRAAAAETDAKERALRSYLEAAAQSFATNDWGPADEAWSKMNAVNSRYYVRIGPDEVLNDPCNQKAQFHLTFARIDAESLDWQRRLAPLEDEMERELARRIGAPYAPRRVTFHLPDFIEVVFNAGDDRAPFGGTGGQSLPNWGKVAAQGRGRTVVMSNLFLDRDSLERARKRNESLVDSDTMRSLGDYTQAEHLATILHEATHNLGPTNVYVYQGKTPEAAFGGRLASMLEELKAETGALWYVDWLKKKGLVSEELALHTYGDAIAWAMRHVASGMHPTTGDEAYAQLAAIQLGFLLGDGVLAFDPSARAANGVDKGAFVVHFGNLPASIEKLMALVGGIKARADRAGADALVQKYVDGEVVPQKLIAERVLRFPQATLVYAVDL
jgi:hypothetical protein